MTASFVHTLICLVAGITVIILLTAKYRVHAFFALIIACFVVGLGLSMPVASIISTAREGFGNIMQSLGLVIVLGTTLGVLLEHSGLMENIDIYSAMNEGWLKNMKKMP